MANSYASPTSSPRPPRACTESVFTTCALLPGFHGLCERGRSWPFRFFPKMRVIFPQDAGSLLRKPGESAPTGLRVIHQRFPAARKADRGGGERGQARRAPLGGACTSSVREARGLKVWLAVGVLVNDADEVVSGESPSSGSAIWREWLAQASGRSHPSFCRHQQLVLAEPVSQAPRP